MRVATIGWVTASLLGGCAALPDLPALPPADVLLLGEQHDAPEHQRLQQATVHTLARQGRLAAVVIEMAEQGHSTQGLPPQASDADAQAALQWNDRAWPWRHYGPVIMAAVRAGVPVWGGNLPRSAQKQAMADTRWDTHLPPAALERQYTALREGHCGLLPESQIPGMARIQLARDAAMAHTAQQAQQPGRTVLLIAGAGHVLKHQGIPTHWPATLRYQVLLAHTGALPPDLAAQADQLWPTPAPPAAPDACAALRPPA